MANIKEKNALTDLPFLIVASSLALYFTSHYSYSLFHALVELFTVVIAFGIFAIAWSSRRYINNNFLLIIGISYFFVGSLDLIHTLSYKGLELFEGFDSNLPTQIWIIARYLEAASFVAAFWLMKKETKQNMIEDAIKKGNRIFIFYLALFILAIVSVFYLHNFPTVYVEGSGLTEFKKISEYIISALFLLSVFLLFKKKKALDKEMVNLLSVSLIVKIMAEISFTEYVGVFDFANMLGHLLKFISFLLLYKAILEAGLMKPYQFLFADLKKSEERYRSLVELSPDPIVVHSGGIIMFANSPAKILFSADEEAEIVGAHLADFFHPDYRQQIRTRIKKVTSGELKRTPTTEMEVLRPDGKTVPVEIRGIKITFMGRSAVESIIRDVSERKKAEEKIRSLAKFPEENPNPVIRVQGDGQVQYFNQPAREMLSSLGWNDKAPMPQPLLAAVKDVLEHGVKNEIELENSDRRQFAVVLSPSPTENWVNLYGRDITERKKAEKELAKTQAQLRKKIEEQLAESYTYLGLVNRKISMLLEMEKHSRSKKDKQEIIDYILASALGLSRAKAGLLYILSGKNHFNLISVSGMEKEKTGHLQMISSREAGFVAELVSEKTRVNGSCEWVDCGSFNKDLEFSYFVALPILSDNLCRGFLFLGFEDRKSMEAQDLEFLDVFSRHVSSALSNSGILNQKDMIQSE